MIDELDRDQITNCTSIRTEKGVLRVADLYPYVNLLIRIQNMTKPIRIRIIVASTEYGLIIML